MVAIIIMVKPLLVDYSFIWKNLGIHAGKVIVAIYYYLTGLIFFYYYESK